MLSMAYSSTWLQTLRLIPNATKENRLNHKSPPLAPTSCSDWSDHRASRIMRDAAAAHSNEHLYIHTRPRPIWCRVGCENRKHKTCIERAIISPARRRLHPLWPRATHSGLSPTAQSVHIERARCEKVSHVWQNAAQPLLILCVCALCAQLKDSSPLQCARMPAAHIEKVNSVILCAWAIYFIIWNYYLRLN